MRCIRDGWGRQRGTGVGCARIYPVGKFFGFFACLHLTFKTSRLKCKYAPRNQPHEPKVRPLDRSPSNPRPQTPTRDILALPLRLWNRATSRFPPPTPRQNKFVRVPPNGKPRQARRESQTPSLRYVDGRQDSLLRLSTPHIPKLRSTRNHNARSVARQL